MNAPEILHLVNSEDGLEAIVTELSSEGTIRYRVKFMDTDADQTIAILTLPTKERAEWYAHLIQRPE